MIRRFRVIGFGVFVALGLLFLFLLAAAYLALKILLWLLPFIIVVVAVWALMTVFNKPRKKKDALDVKFKVK